MIVAFTDQMQCVFDWIRLLGDITNSYTTSTLTTVKYNDIKIKENVSYISGDCCTYRI